MDPTKQRSFSIQSPNLQPALLLESPALMPHHNPGAAPSSEDTPIFFKRKRSESGEFMDDGRSFLFPMMYQQRKESIYTLNPEDKDKDGFRWPTRQDDGRVQRPADGQQSPVYPSYSNNRVSIPLAQPPRSPGIPSAFRSPGRAAQRPPEFMLPGSPAQQQFRGPGMPFSPAFPMEYDKPAELRPQQMLYSPYAQRSPANPQQQQFMQMVPSPYQGGFRLDAERLPLEPPKRPEPPVSVHVPPQPERMIGTLTVSQRKDKIQKYLEKRKRRIWKKKICYDCRKKVADKRLRVKGRFVTREQAYALLGTTPEELAKNELLRKYANSNRSIVTLAQNMKVRNIQTLLAPAGKAGSSSKTDKDKEKEKSEEPAHISQEQEKTGVKVELLRENEGDQVVEVRIESFRDKGEDGKNPCKDKEDETKMQPKIRDPVFVFTRVKAGEFCLDHIKYHREST